MRIKIKMIMTIGPTANVSVRQVMAILLKGRGKEVTNDEEDSVTVKGQCSSTDSEQKMTIDTLGPIHTPDASCVFFFRGPNEPSA
jgi:hypothetical protein